MNISWYYFLNPQKFLQLSLSMSKLESNPMPLMDDQYHTIYYFEDDSFPTFN
jgi:hypothetical protein